MHEIAGYLTLDNWACLMYTSYYFRSFFCGINFSMKDFRGLGAAKYSGTPEEHENFKWLNERDHPPDVTNPKARAYCSKCETLISIKHFRHNPFECDRRKRQCLGHEGRIWHCPHDRLTFEELESFIEERDKRNNKKQGRCWDCPQRVVVFRRCDCKTCTRRRTSFLWTTFRGVQVLGHPITSPPWTTMRAVLVIGRPVLNIPEGRIISTERQLMDALKIRHFSICSHLQMNDRRALARFKFRRSPSQPAVFEYDTATILQGRCNKCDTKIKFEVYENGPYLRERGYPKRVVVMCIKHHFDHSLVPYASQWLSMITTPSEMERQEEADSFAVRFLGLQQEARDWGHRLGPFVMGRKQLDV